ncbi:hypothetical protein ALC60_05811 [Trachymyrmex zeteki]|uniref:Uncharacterized protein n=1 Tax=Mycetomoellerius zeteki TaxID=64791 RepID=A0A151X432_9HYME|nr:hypothetical protein ALC60_05811 [Trachymyrmex zeteki]
MGMGGENNLPGAGVAGVILAEQLASNATQVVARRSGFYWHFVPQTQRFPDAWTSDAINIDHSRPTGVHPKCAVPGCIDKPIARCDVAAIDGPRAANIVVTIMTTLVTFAYY